MCLNRTTWVAIAKQRASEPIYCTVDYIGIQKPNLAVISVVMEIHKIQGYKLWYTVRII